MSCPNINTPEFKQLTKQLGSEEAAIYTWKAYNEEFPPSNIFKPTSEIKKELGVRNKISSLAKALLAKRVAEYNNKNGTSHHFIAKRIGESDTFDIDFKVNYLPKKIAIKQEKLFSKNPKWKKGNNDILNLETEGLELKESISYNNFSLEKLNTLTDDEKSEILRLQQEEEDYEEFIKQSKEEQKYKTVDNTVNNELNNRLFSFLQKLNPNFKVEMLDKLNEESKAYISEFVIELKDLDDMPEEVAHFFFELLPEGSLKNEMLKNISRFDIYEETLQEYKNDKEYQNEDGTINYNKIKNEAVAKLIAKYLKTLSSKDINSLQEIEKKVFSIKEWIKKFLKWLKSERNEELINSYKEAAQMILNMDVSQLDTSLAEGKGVFKSKSKAPSFAIVEKIRDSKNINGLKSVLDKVRRELKNITKNLEKSNLKDKINEALKQNNLPDVEQLLQNIKNIKVNKYNDDATTLLSVTNSFNDFINIISDYEKIYKAIEFILENDELSKDFFENIKELQNYRNIYSNIVSLFDNELQTLLQKSGVESKLTSYVMSLIGNIKAVDKLVLNKIKENIKGYIVENFEEINEAVRNQLKQELEILNKDPKNNAKIIEKRKQLLENSLVEEKFVDDLLNGIGQDMSSVSQFSYYVLAAVKNGDVVVSKLANILADERKDKMQKASNIFLKFQKKIETLLTNLGNKGLDIYKIGEKLTFVETIIDKTIKDGKRQVLTFLNPHKNIEFKRNNLENELNELRELKETNPTSENIKRWQDKRIELLDFMYNYYNNRYKGEYKEFDYNWKKNNKFYEIFSKLKEYNESISILEKQFKLASNKEKNELRKEILELKRQKSNLFNKTGKTGEELEKTELLIKHFEELKKFQEVDVEKTQKNIKAKVRYLQNELDDLFQELEDSNPYGEVLISDISFALKKQFGTDFSFQSFLKAVMIDEYDTEDIGLETKYNEKTTTELDLIKQKILLTYEKSLTRKIPTESFKNVQKEEFDEINRLSQPNEYTEILQKLRNKRYEIVKKIKNEFGEPNLDYLDEEEKRKLLAYERILMLYSFAPYSSEINYGSYSPKNLATMLDNLIINIDSGDVFNAGQIEADLKNALSDVKNIYNNEYLFLSEQEQERIDELQSIIKAYYLEIVEKEYNDYYWEKISQLPDILDDFFRLNNIKFTNRQMLDLLSNIEYRNIDNLLLFFSSKEFTSFLENYDVYQSNNQIKDFANWFQTHHVFKTQKIKNETEGNIDIDYSEIDTYLPTISYSYTTPILDSHTATKYSKDVVSIKIKDNYLNEKTDWKTTKDSEKWTIDNRGLWLPLTMEQLKQQHGNNWKNFSQFINEDFYNLKQDKDAYELLTTSVEYYLNQQDSLEDDLKSWYNVPVTELDKYEEKTNIVTNFKGTVDELKTKVNTFFNKKSTSGEAFDEIEEYKQKEDYDIEGVVFKNKNKPKLGMFSKLPIERVSRNFLNSLFIYTVQVGDYDARTKMDSLFQPIIEIMESAFTNNHTSQKKRLETIKKLRSQNILKEIPDNLLNKPAFRKIITGILTMSGLKLTVDAMGGASNLIQANINNITEALANKHFSFKNYIKGKSLASKMLMSVTSDFGKGKDLSFWTQMLQSWDFIQGDFVDDISGRTSVKAKFFNFRNLLMSPRTSGEIHAQSEIGLAILDNTKVLNNLDNKEYPVHEIYHLVNGVLTLKDGFDPEWNIGKSKFLELRKKIHNINLELHGNFADVNQTELSRHGIGKLIESMKRWYTIAINRKLSLTETFDTTTNTFSEGYYVTAVKALFSILGSAIGIRKQSLASTIEWFTQNETKKKNLIRATADISFALLLFMFYTVVLGWDDDDEDKYEKMRKKSYFSQFLLVLSLKASAEQTSLIPYPGYGLQEMKRNILTPWSLATDVISNTVGIGDLGITHLTEIFGIENDRKLYYQKDTRAFLGEKGDPKIARYLLKMFGYTGSQYEPDYWLKNWVNQQGRLK